MLLPDDLIINNNCSKSMIKIHKKYKSSVMASMSVDKKTVSKMKKNSVIVDLAAGTGGNCELTKVGKVVQKDGVKIVGEMDILKNVKHAATKLYSENIRNLVQLLEENPEDEIFEEMSKHD